MTLTAGPSTKKSSQKPSPAETATKYSWNEFQAADFNPHSATQESFQTSGSAIPRGELPAEDGGGGRGSAVSMSMAARGRATRSIGMAFAPLTPITPPLSSVLLASNSNNCRPTDGSRKSADEPKQLVETHYVGLGLKIDEQIDLDLHGSHEDYRPTRGTQGSLYKESKSRAAQQTGTFYSQAAPSTGGDGEHQDETTPPPTPVPLVLELASSPPSPPPWTSTLLSLDALDSTELALSQRPATNSEMLSRKVAPYRQTLTHAQLNWHHPNSSSYLGSHPHPYPHSQPYLAPQSQPQSHIQSQPQSQIQSQSQPQSRKPHEQNHPDHVCHFYVPETCLNERQFQQSPQAYLFSSKQRRILQDDQLTPDNSVSPSKEISKQTTTDPTRAHSPEQIGVASQAGTSGHDEENKSGKNKFEERLQYDQKAQSQNREYISSTKDSDLIEPAVRRGRSHHPRLLWRSKIPKKVLDALEQRHLNQFGERIPRLVIPTVNNTGTNATAVESLSTLLLPSPLLVKMPSPKRGPVETVEELENAFYCILGTQELTDSKCDPNFFSPLDDLAKETDTKWDNMDDEVSVKTTTKPDQEADRRDSSANLINTLTSNTKRQPSNRLASLSLIGRKWSEELDKSGL